MDHGISGETLESIKEEMLQETQGLDFDALGEPVDRRTEWLIERLGYLTASQFNRITTFQDKTDLPPGAITYVTECALEILTEVDLNSRSFYNEKMDWGNDNEGFAAVRFMKETGLWVENYGTDQRFIKMGEHIGCTPDGIIRENGRIISGLETKCPDSKTHMAYMRAIKTAADLKQVMAKYYWQCVGSMYITGADSWYFVSFDPRWKKYENQYHCIRIDRAEVEANGDMLFLRMRIGKSIEQKVKTIKEFE